MANKFHKDSIDDDNHAVTAKTYADIATRDADTDFQVTENINKDVRIDTSPVRYYRLVSVGPAVWSQMDSTGADTFLEMTDVSPDIPTYTGQAGKVTQVNVAETGLELGQQLRTTDNPTFNDLILTGDLTVQGTTTTLDTQNLLVEDKNIIIGNVTTPTDITADGGGITLLGTTNKTINWVDATNSWTFNQKVDLLANNLTTTGNVTAVAVILDNFLLTGNAISTTSGDLDVTTATGGVFKFVDNAFQAGLDGSNYLEIGHGGSNSFINHVGSGEMDFRFGGVNKASFTTAGHLHLKTDVDQKHTLKIITANNLNDTGLAFENSGGSFTHTIFRTDVGSNRADLVFAAGLNSNIDLLTNSFKIHGEASDEGKLEVLGVLQISSGSPAAGNVLTSVAGDGIATWEIPNPTAGGWTDDGTTVRLTTSTDKVVIGSNTGFGAQLEVVAGGAGTVGGFASGAFQIRDPSAAVNANAVITGHNSNGGNKQLWYLGSTSSSNDNIAFINRQNAELHFHTNDLNRFSITAAGNVGINELVPSEKLEVGGNAIINGFLTANQLNVDNLRLDGNILSGQGTDQSILLVPTGTGGVFLVADTTISGDLIVDTVIDDTIFAQLSSSVDQEPTVTTPVVITYNTQDAIAGLTHSTTVNPGEITVDTAGIYFISPQPQVGKDSGGVKVTFDMFMQVDRGSGFADEANSNIKLSIKDADITDVIVSALTISLAVGDKVRFMQRVSSSSVGMGLKATAAETGPPTIPATPAIIFTMYRVGGI